MGAFKGGAEILLRAQKSEGETIIFYYYKTKAVMNKIYDQIKEGFNC